MNKSKRIILYKDNVESIYLFLRVDKKGHIISNNERAHYTSCKLKYIRNRNRKNKKLAVEWKGGRCERCGLKSIHYEIYDFHHIDSTTKEYKISKLLSNSFEAAKIELEKSILLCANCHRIIHWELKNDEKI